MKQLLLYLILLVSLAGRAQTFTGRVVDAGGTPLVATSVVAKGDGPFQGGDEPVVIRQGREGGLVELHGGGAHSKEEVPLPIDGIPGPDQQLRGLSAGPAAGPIVLGGQVGNGHFTMPRIFSYPASQRGRVSSSRA